MKRILFLVILGVFWLYLIYALSAQAQTTTTVTGTLKDLTGATVTSGKVTFDLQPSRDTTISGLARFTPQTVTCLLNGSGQIKAQDGVSICTMQMNTALQPPGSYYKVCDWPNNVKTACFTFYAVLASYDWSTVVPTPATSPAQNFVDVFSNQTIGGNKIWTGSQTFNAVITSMLNTATVFANPGESVAHAVARLPVGGGRVVFDVGTYPSGNVVISTPGITLQGAGMPSYNGTYTALTGPGTIIQGPINAIQGADHFVVRNLGIDVGSAWVNASNGGVQVTALGISNQGQVVGASQVQAPIIEDVSCLGFSPTSANHCMLVENVNDASIRNIVTVFGVYGLAFKGTNSTIDGFWGRSHGTNAIIIKSDAYAVSSNVHLANFTIGTITPGDLYGGVYLTATGSNLSFINISNGIIQNASQFDIFLQGGATTPVVSEVNISGVTMDNALELGADCVLLTGFVQFVNGANLNCSNATNGVHISSPASGLLNHVNIANSSFAFLSGDGVQTYDFADVTGNTFKSIAGAGIHNTSPGTNPTVSGNTMVGVVTIYNGGVITTPLRASLTTTAATTDNVAIPGMTAAGRCTLTPTNAGAAGGMAATFISAKTTDQITVTHTATASWTFDILCTPF
jgi:hypothetical protein